MDFKAGTELAHYRLIDKLGEGGMGFVWRALDTKLDREVAIKVLPEQFVQDPERVGRFEREAKVLAQLNHPNIAAVYGYDRIDDTLFLVMELVPGQDLAERLAGGPLPFDEAIDVCRQIALALETAHDAGVIHRDLKPANVRITADGDVKVLDFGLAKAFGSGPISGDPGLSPTLTSMGTVAGTILGSASYMSPEQARAKPVDKRADIWAFGCVVFECLTGRRAFPGETISDSLAAILRGEPDWESLSGSTPRRVRELLERAMTKDPRERLRDIGDARFELERVQSGAPDIAAPAASRATGRRSVLLAALAAFVGAAVGIAVWTAFSGAAPPPRGAGVTRLSLRMPDGEQGLGVLLAPDGARAYVRTVRDSPVAGEVGIHHWIRRLDGFEFEPLPDWHNVRDVGFSPDGAWMYYRGTETADSTRTRLFKVPLDGSAPRQVLAEDRGKWSGRVIWIADDRLVVTTADPAQLVTIAADGSGTESSVDITQDVVGSYFATAPLPDGIHLLGDLVTFDERGYMHHVSLLDTRTGAIRVLIEDGYLPAWSTTGHILFTRHDTLLAAPFDMQRLEPTGTAQPILRGLGVEDTYSGADFGLSANGTLIYPPGGVRGGQRRLATVGADGVVEDWSVGHRAITEGPVVSPDETHVAVTVIGDTGLDEVWVADAERRTLRRTIAVPRMDCDAIDFTADNRLFYACGGSEETVWSFHAPEGPDREVWRSGGDGMKFLAQISPDGSRGFYRDRSGAGGPALGMVTFATATEPNHETQLLEDVGRFAFNEDGKWLAYSTDITGRYELWVRSFDGDRLGPEIPVTSEGIGGFSWAPREGPDELCYRTLDNRRSCVTLRGGKISPPVPQPWINGATERADGWAYLRGGRLMLILKGEEEVPQREYHVVVGFGDELAERFATPR